MIRRLVAWWLLGAFLAGFSTPAKRDALNLQPVINAFLFDGVETKITWDTCGQVNAYYHPSTRTVTLCNELKTLPPGVIRYVLAHELSHSVIMQRGVAYTGSHEASADELAAVMLILLGNEQDVLAGAAFWAGLGRDEDPYDDHPGDLRRAHTLRCLVWTSQDEPFAELVCNANYSRVVSAWVRLLKMDVE